MTEHKIRSMNGDTSSINNGGQTNHINLQKRVVSVHQNRIKQLQKEVVQMTLMNDKNNTIKPLLAEINKLRELLNMIGTPPTTG